MKKFTFLLLFIAFAGYITAQTTIVYQDFESVSDDWSYTPTPPAYNESSGTDVWDVVTSMGTLSTMPTSGTYFWGIRDIDNGGSGGPFYHVIEFASVDISTYSNVTISFDWEADGWEATDKMNYEVFFDDVSQEEVEFFTGGTGGVDGSGTETIPVTGGTSAVYLKISAIQNGGSDYGGWDNFKVTGLAAGGVSNPTDFEAVTGGTDNIDLSWTKNANGDDVMVAINTSPISATPVDGTTYSDGDTFGDGSEVIYNGANTTHSESGLTSNTRYYFKAWSLDATPNYSSGVTDDTTTLADEPTADPTLFAATTNSASEITLDWTDAVPAADSYLIKGSDVDYASIIDPVDGSPEVDGSLVQNVAAGGETHQFTGLTPGTTYYFQIYPYNGDNGSVNYKTDNPQQASETTDSHTDPNAWINEFHYDNASGDEGEFVEIVIEDAISYTLSDLQLDLYNGSGGVVYGTHTVDGFTEGNTQGNFTFYSKLISGIQNGPDGFALSYQGILITGQFLSYEGTVNATEGPASGETSTNIGVSESGGTQIGESLQLRGGGDDYDLFYWQWPAAETPGALNHKQYFGSYTTFTGATDNTWATAANWNNGVPDATLNVIVPQDATNFPTLSAAGTCDNIIIESNADGNASILGNSNLTVSGTTTVERYFEGYDDALNGWHNIGSPVDNMLISGTDFDPTGTSDDLYQWNESSGTWENYKQNHFTNFTNGKGYLCAFQATATKNFTGTLNTADVPWADLSFDADGWHLLGNHFPSAITWDLPDVDWDLTAIGGTAKIWNELGGNYADIAAGGIIPSTNGFFIEVTNATNGLTIPASARVHDATNNYKSSRAEEMDETLVFKITNDENSYYDINRVGFREDATEAWDPDFDSHKLFGAATAPQLWTVTDGDIFSWNNLPYVYESYQVPLHFRAGVNSTYHINVSGIESFYDNSEFYLEDLFTNELINLSDQQVYTFTATTDDDEARFILHFYGVTSVDEPIATTEAQIYAAGKTVYIRFNNLTKNDSNVEVFNTLGQQVYNGDLTPQSLSSFTLNEKPGIYIVRLRTENGLITQKVMIK